MAFFDMGLALGSPRNYENFSKEAYQKCVVAFRCIKLISLNATKIPIILYKKTSDGNEEVLSHEILDLLSKPNPLNGYETLIENVFGYFNISGNSFLRAVRPGPNRPPRELVTLRPDRIKINPGAGMIPSQYIHKIGLNDEEIYPVDLMGRSDVMHMRSFNPLDDYYGMSPVEAASLSIDQQNASNRWNLSLLKNESRPSGVIKITQDDKNSGRLSPEQRESLQKKLEDRWSGTSNAGRPVILQGGMEWQQTGLSPRDMDFYNSNKVSKSDVAIAFGVPGQMVGVEGSQTFANYEQAVMSFYDDTVIPQFRIFVGYLNRWLVPMFGDQSIFLGYDEDKIGAYEPRRAAKRQALIQCNYLTTNEKREAEGYGFYEEGEEPGDQILVSSGLMPLSMALDFSSQSDDSLNPDEVDDYQPDEDNPDEEQGEGENQEDYNGDDDSKTDSGFEFKAFNLRTNNSKRSYARAYQKKIRLHEDRLRKSLSSYFNAEGKQIIKLIESTEKEVWDYGTTTILNRNHDKLKSIFEASIRSTMDDFGKSLIEGTKSMFHMEHKSPIDKFKSIINSYVTSEAIKATDQVNRTTKKMITKKIRDALQADVMEGTSIKVEAPKLVGKLYDQFKKNRSKIITRTEIHNAATKATMQAAKSLDLPSVKKEWNSARDDRTRREEPTHKHWADHYEMDGVKVDMDDTFSVPSSDGNDIMDGPGDTSAPLDQFINCRCFLTFSTQGE
jgi:HK97 family phage portal protein